MLKIKLLFITVALFAFPIASAVADSNSDLQGRTQELNQLRQDINKKKVEKDQLVKEEKKVKKELQRITSSIAGIEKQLKLLQSKIKEAEKNLEYASQQYSEADREKHNFGNKIENEVFLYSRRKLVKYFDYPLEFKMRLLSINDKYDKFNIADNKEKKAQSNMIKYDNAKRTFISLKNKQENLINQNKKLKQEKNELLKTTAGKRVQAEQDIKALNDSAKALQSLINKLMQASKSKKRITSLRSASTERRNNLPWPVDGQIVLNYGKNKHPDLNTNVISNGIKIKARNNAIIKSVDEGEVVFTGEFRSYGKMIIIDHKGVFFSVYGELGNILVSEGQAVSRGANIAKLGSGDNSVLYFEIRQYNVPENPVLWLEEK
ncbi:MAG: peptidoglycan DD-metalloendopeptidase family protein [Endomicrobiaceae bacterium]|jgi:septal ring factor EnvC (AmiA/AmiB activator)|nr:peptidoglycan DD-metalloendopeptidase family protein [Endomicrobiaceae bacterium]